MKNRFLIGIAMIMLLAIAVPWANAATDTQAPAAQAPSVQAPAPATPSGPYTLNDQQKKEVQPIYNKILDARKQLIQKYVDYGKITKDQADYYTKRMEDMQKYREENGFGPGMGCGGFGGGGRWGWNAPQTAPQATPQSATSSGNQV